jgi:hypothetical protein
LKWDFFGNYIVEDYSWKCNKVFRNNFFVMYSEGKWVFNIQANYDNEDEYIVGPYIPPELRKRFERFQGVKVFLW